MFIPFILCFFFHTITRPREVIHRIMIFLYDFGVLLYRRTLTLISPFFPLYCTTPILAIDILVIRPDLKKDPTRARRMENVRVLPLPNKSW